MGNREPLDNYENFLTFIRLLTDEHGLHISQRNITVSTCGIVPRMYDLAKKSCRSHWRYPAWFHAGEAETIDAGGE